MVSILTMLAIVRQPCRTNVVERAFLPRPYLSIAQSLRHHNVLASIQLFSASQVHGPVEERYDVRVKGLPVRYRWPTKGSRLVWATAYRNKELFDHPVRTIVVVEVVLTVS